MHAIPGWLRFRCKYLQHAVERLGLLETQSLDAIDPTGAAGFSPRDTGFRSGNSRRGAAQCIGVAGTTYLTAPQVAGVTYFTPASATQITCQRCPVRLLNEQESYWFLLKGGGSGSAATSSTVAAGADAAGS